MGRLLAALAVLAALPAPAAAVAPLRLTGRERLDARLSELTFRTPALAGPTRVRVLLPRGYAAHPARRYPVLYLLHGAYNDQRAWTEQGEAERATAGRPLIVVMPDGGFTGGYTDWFNGGAFGPPAWETYHIGQLLPWVDAHLRTVARRAGRAVAGLSMGGGGAMKYAARHPDLFTAAASFSGTVDLNDPALVATGDPAVRGDYAHHELRWRDDNAWDLAANLRGLALWLRSGHGDGVESVVAHETRGLHDRLTRLGIAHRYDPTGTTGHVWATWRRDLRAILPGLMRRFAHPRPAPSPFSFRRAAPAFAVYGWRVQRAGRGLAWTRLVRASRRGFGLASDATGSVLVTTARSYRPRAHVTLRVNGVRGAFRAGRDGRVRVRVSRPRALRRR